MSAQRETLEQQRARRAWEIIQRRRGERDFSKYRNLAKSAPALVAGNGLLPTMLFYRQKGKAQHNWLLEDLRDWLHARKILENFPVADTEAYKKALVDASPGAYRLATDEALQLLRWIRQFASAVPSARE